MQSSITGFRYSHSRVDDADLANVRLIDDVPRRAVIDDPQSKHHGHSVVLEETTDGWSGDCYCGKFVYIYQADVVELQNREFIQRLK